MYCVAFFYALIVIIITREATCQSNSTYVPIADLEDLTYKPDLVLDHDPQNGFFSPSIFAVFVRTHYFDGNNEVYPTNAKIYYARDGDPNSAPQTSAPTLESAFATPQRPYIQVDTPFGHGRMRNLSIIAVVTINQIMYKSAQINLIFAVEGYARPDSYMFLVPGIQSNGYFVAVSLEVTAPARAQASTSGGQEFANFFSISPGSGAARFAGQGIGTYNGQVKALDLRSLNISYTGFEGGFTVNCSNGKYYGVLIPFHNGKKFSGLVVRVDLLEMTRDVDGCLRSHRLEYYSDGVVMVEGTSNETACIFALDLSTIHPRAVGFRRGFANYPYGYLSPGEFNIPVRLDMENFRINTTSIVDLGRVSNKLGGYSGGFADGTWACFCPYRTFTGPVGGVRSKLPVDQGHLQVYYHGLLTCVDEEAWSINSTFPAQFNNSIQILDLSALQPQLRGFSDAVRVGRYAYLSPLQTDNFIFTSKVIRIFLGNVDVGSTIQSLGPGVSVGTIMSVLDLSQKDPRLAGYSGIFSIGQFIHLVPFRSAFEPQHGQRGHGMLARIDMNNFNLDGIEFIDMTTTIRTQTPATNEIGLRGFVSGFASAQYGFTVPFYNGVFSGKVGRWMGTKSFVINSTNNINLQELDLAIDPITNRSGLFVGYRGGFVSLWQGTPDNYVDTF